MGAGKLGYARLLWHLYVPKSQRSRASGAADIERTEEIDIALLAAHGLFSIEVKSLHGIVEVQLDSRRDVYLVTNAIVENGQHMFGGTTIDAGAGQNAATKRAAAWQRLSPLGEALQGRRPV